MSVCVMSRNLTWFLVVAGAACAAAPEQQNSSTGPSADDLASAATTAEAIDNFGTCGALCHGACGSNCDPCNYSYRSVCEVDNSGNMTGYQRKITHYTCGSHEACQFHDSCYDACAASASCSWSYSACMAGCDAQVVASFCPATPWTCVDWANGTGPTDQTLTFEYWSDTLPPTTGGADPGGRAWNPGACPPPATCTLAGQCGTDSCGVYHGCSGDATCDGFNCIQNCHITSIPQCGTYTDTCGNPYDAGSCPSGYNCQGGSCVQVCTVFNPPPCGIYYDDCGYPHDAGPCPACGGCGGCGACGGCGGCGRGCGSDYDASAEQQLF